MGEVDCERLGWQRVEGWGSAQKNLEVGDFLTTTFGEERPTQSNLEGFFVVGSHVSKTAHLQPEFSAGLGLFGAGLALFLHLFLLTAGFVLLSAGFAQNGE